MSKSIELGALWKKKTRNGDEFFSGTVNIFPYGQVQVNIFKNNYKQNDNHPDYKILYNPKEPQAPGGLERSDSSDNFGGETF